MKKVLWALLPGLVFALSAAAAEPARTLQYVELFQAQPVETGDKIEVRELFWYGCPHCNDLEPVLNRWLERKPDNVTFVRTPAVLRESWVPHAKAYYAFQALGVTDKLHSAFFRAIHVEKRRLRDAESIAAFAAEHGIDKQRFLSAYNSFAVDSKVRQARVMGEHYETNGVPTIIVDGKYRTTSTLAGGHEALMKVVDALIKQAAAERKQKAG